MLLGSTGVSADVLRRGAPEKPPVHHAIDDSLYTDSIPGHPEAQRCWPHMCAQAPLSLDLSEFRCDNTAPDFSFGRGRLFVEVCLADHDDVPAHNPSGETCRRASSGRLRSISSGHLRMDPWLDSRLEGTPTSPSSTNNQDSLPLWTGELLRAYSHNLRDAVVMSADLCSAFLYASGLSLVSKTDGAEHTFAWNPFVTISKAFGPKQAPVDGGPLWLFVLAAGRGSDEQRLILATRGEEAEKERGRWLSEISKALRALIKSLLPSFALTVEPLGSRLATARRLLAGHLLLRPHSSWHCCVCFCDLQAYQRSSAQLIIYENEMCEKSLWRLYLTSETRLHIREGEGSSSFTVDGHAFCARSRQEALLWLRALGNVKVKIQNGAPDPSEDELNVFRAAVWERVLAVGAADVERQRARCSSRIGGSARATSAGRSADFTSTLEFSAELAGGRESADLSGFRPKLAERTLSRCPTVVEARTSDPLPVLPAARAFAQQRPVPPLARSVSHSFELLRGASAFATTQAPASGDGISDQQWEEVMTDKHDEDHDEGLWFSV